MSIVYLVFDVYNKTSTFLAACATQESAVQFITTNNFSLREGQKQIYTTRAAALYMSSGGLVVEKVALI